MTTVTSVYSSLVSSNRSELTRLIFAVPAAHPDVQLNVCVNLAGPSLSKSVNTFLFWTIHQSPDPLHSSAQHPGLVSRMYPHSLSCQFRILSSSYLLRSRQEEKTETLSKSIYCPRKKERVLFIKRDFSSSVTNDTMLKCIKFIHFAYH